MPSTGSTFTGSSLESRKGEFGWTCASSLSSSLGSRELLLRLMTGGVPSKIEKSATCKRLGSCGPGSSLIVDGKGVGGLTWMPKAS